MRLRPLPFLQHLNTLPPEEQLAQKNQAMEALMRTPGVQLFYDAIADTEFRILMALRQGSERPERCAGGLEAIEKLRRLLWDLYPKRIEFPVEAEEEESLEQIYESSFDIPLPSGEAPVSDFS